MSALPSRSRRTPAVAMAAILAAGSMASLVVGPLAGPASALQLCVTPGADGSPASVTGVVNTYYPVTASVAAGATTLSVGTATGASTAAAAGDELLVLQVQGATFTTTNSSAYGANGTLGRGSTARTAGTYEYVKVASVASGTITVVGGAGGGLLNAYTVGTGSRVEAVRVPQYATTSLTSGLTARAWDGSTGGVLAIDVAGALGLGSATVSLDGKGFRGGGSRATAGATGLNGTDYVTSAASAANGEKGEGYAGSPTLPPPAAAAGAANGYPGGDFARGAPGNAGGGGTDADPAGNDQNTGGGGGGNGGIGGVGGNSWSSNAADGGIGGAAVTSSATSAVFGGGGGAGTVNNGGSGPGAAGGGAAFIRVGSVTGTGTVSAAGATAVTDTVNDGGGAGGAGGSVLVTAPAGVPLTGLTVSANGGAGGGANTSAKDPHGPGGGGAGGWLLTSSAPTATSVTGGANGTSVTTAGAVTAYGAGPGAAGQTATITAASVPGVAEGAACPVAVADTATTIAGASAGVPVGLSVLTNDTPSTGVTPAVATAPVHGSTSVSGGVITYTPAGGFSGVDTFTYADTNARGVTGSAVTDTVTVRPTAPDSAVSVVDGQTLTGAVPATIGTGSFSYALVTAPADAASGGFVFNTDGTYTYTPKYPFSGTDSFTYTATGAGGTSNAGTVTITVSKPPLSASPLTSSGVGTTVQSVTPTVPNGGSFQLLNGSGTSVPSLTVSGQGTYAVSGSTITFSPVLGFSGTATAATYRLTDAFGQTATSTYTPTVTKPGLTASPLTSSGVGTAVQSVTPATPASGSFQLLNGSGTSVPSLTVSGQGTYAVSGSTITFTPVLGFSGTATAATYQLTDAYGTTATSTDTPTVTKPALAASPLTSSGVGTAVQSVTPSTPTGGSFQLLNGSGTSVPSLTVSGQGTYAVSGSTITFTPVLGFSGTATPATYQLTDAYGTKATSTDTPTVTKPGLTASPLTSSGVGTAVQSVTPATPASGSFQLLNGSGTSVPSLTVSGQGTYAVSGSTITFTPVLGFSGTATPATYQLTDAYGTTATSTDTPTVTKPGLTASPLTSSGIGTAVQSVTPATPAGGSFQLLDGSGTSVPSLTVPGQGTYAVSGATITFTPVLGFSGTATPATYQLTDAYSTTATSTDTPTVTKPGGPTATPLTSTGVGTAVQSVTPATPSGGSFQLLNGSGTSVPSLTISGQGTYAVSGSTITFTPVLGFSGTATPATYQLTDAYGTTATSTDTPTVTKPAGPTATPLTSTGVGTAVESVTPTVPTGGSFQLLNGPGTSVPSLTVSGQGTYAVSGSTITFTPVLGFSGTATPATYQLTDAYGTKATSTDTPTVTKPALSASPLTSTGVGTAVQSVTPATPAGGSFQLLDGSGTSVPSVTVSGQGTYAVSGATITFTPVLGYSGTATAATYQLTDAYGTTATSTDTPTVTKPAGPTASPLTSTGVGTAVQSVTPTVPAGGSFQLLDGSGTSVPSLTVANQGTYAVSGATITFTPVLGFSGTATPATYQLTDAYGTTATSTDTPTVTKPALSASPLTSTGVGTAVQSVTPTVPANGSFQLLNGSGTSVPSVAVPGQGTYAVNGSAITFTPVLGFSGTATAATYQLTDAYGTKATSTDTPTVTKPGGLSAAPLTSTGVGTAVQSVTPATPAGGSFQLLNSSGTSVPSLTVTNQGTYAVSGSTITFTPVLGFSGTATAATYQLTDAYGTTATSTDTPTVTKPALSASPLTSTGVGTAVQSVTPTVPSSGSFQLLDGSGTSVPSLTVSNQGTYAVSGNDITFTPVLGFSGTATPATYQLTDAYGTTATSSDTPTVTKPAGPTAPPLTSTGVGTATQAVTPPVPPSGSFALLDGSGTPTASLTVTNQGTYAVSGSTITFSPVLGFSGTATPATYRLTDAYGSTATSTDTPTVTKPGLTASPLTSSGVGTAVQSVTPSVPSSGSFQLLDGAGTSVPSLTVSGQGTYAVSGSTITFTPVLGFSGAATAATYQLTDAYGTKATSTDTPTVTKPAGPTANPLTSTGVGTAVQSVTPATPTGGSFQLLNGSGTSVPSLTVSGQGTYAVSGSTITFTPVLGFSGTATPATYQLTDAYGSTATSTDTPTVTKPAGPTANPLTSTGVGTAVQSVTPATPTGGSFQLLNGSGTSVPSVTVSGQGTYAVSGSTITFTPVLGFSGTATPATYQLTDAYGTKATSTDTPTVTKPAGPTANPLTSTGVGTAVQSVTPATPTGGSFQLLNGSGTSVPSLTVSGQGTYAVSGSTITFTPVLGFAGTATPATYQLTDAYGTKATSTDTPTVTKPAGPTANPLTSTGVGTAVQSVTPATPTGGSFQLLNGSGTSVPSLTVSGQGTYAVSGSTITFTPVLGFSGTATAATYQLTDAYGSTATSTDTPTVTKPAGPTANPLTSTGVGTAVQSVTPATPTGGSFQLLNGSGTSVPSLTVPGQGTYAVSGSTITFTPVLGFSGTATPATYQLTDAYGTKATSTDTPTVTKPAGPTATGESATTDAGVTTGTPTTLAGATNDTGTAPLTPQIGTAPLHGTVVINGDGTLTYTPAGNYSGTDTFTYTDTDAYGTASAPATETVTVRPQGTADTSTAAYNTPVSSDPTGNDVGTGLSVTAVTVTAATKGSVVLNANGTVTFTPAHNFVGTDTFTYTGTDSAGQAYGPVTVTVTVSPPGAPVARPDSYSVDTGTPLAGTGLLSNDSGDAIAADPATPTSTQGVVVTVRSDGSFGYTPPSGYSGSDTFTYTVTDSAGQTSPAATVTVTVRPVTTPDTLTAVTGVTTSVPVAGGLLANDTGSSLTAVAQTVTTAHGGRAVIAADGSYSYSSATGYSGPDSFTYQATDGTSTVPGSVAVTVTPVGRADSGSTPFNTTLTVPAASGVLANDTGSTLAAATLTNAPTTQGGSVTLRADGSYTYVPATAFAGTDTFTYTASDGTSAYGPVTVTVTVGKPAAPTAAADSYTTPAGITLTVPAPGVLGNDTGTGTLTATAGGSTPTHGTVTLGTDGRLSYAPTNPDFSGTDTLNYTVADGYGQISPPATVTIRVTPVAVADNASTVVNTALTGASVLGNDHGTGLTAVPQTGVATAHGTVSVRADGTFTYTPAAGFSGTDAFTYTAKDAGNQTTSATVTVIVGTGGAPDTGQTAADTPLVQTTSVLANDSGTGLSVTGSSQPAHGSVTVAASGTYTYRPAAGYSGPDSFTYNGTDGTTTYGPVTVSLTVKPIAVNDTATVADNATIANGASVLGNDDGTGLTVTGKTNGTAGGTVTVRADGSYTYAPPANFSGTDTFTYTLTDGTSSATGTVSVTVTPVAVADTLTAPYETATSGTVLGNDLGSGLTVTAHTDPAAGTGTVTINAAGAYTFTPATGFAGSTGFTYTATDSSGHSSTTTVTVTVLPQGPKAVADTGSTVVDTVLSGPSVLVNDTGSGPLTATATSATTARGGSVTLAGAGTYSYRPPTGFSGVDTYSYTVTDSVGQVSAPGTVTITVAPQALPDSQAVPAGQTLTTTVPTPKGSGPFVTTPGTGVTHGTLTLSSSGGYSYTPATGYLGSDSFTYTATDKSGIVSAPATITISVITPSGPTAVNDAATVPAGTTGYAGASVLTNDQGTGPLTATKATDPAHGTVTVTSSTGDYSYTPTAGYSGPDSFTYTTTDAVGQVSSPATVSLTVVPVGNPDYYTATGGAPFSPAPGAGVLANDLGSGLTATLASPPATGTLVLNANGSFTYTPVNGATGTVSFTYTAKDSSGDSTGPISVSITIGTPSAPVAGPDSGTTPAGTPLTSGANLLGNDTGAGPLVPAVATGPAHGTVTVATNGSYVYTPAAGYSGPDSFTYRDTDAFGTLSAAGTVSIAVVPVAKPDSATLTGGSPFDGTTVLGNDTGSTLTAILGAGPAHGTLTLRSDGTYTYTPTLGYAGVDSFTYRAKDASGQLSPVTTVTLQVVRPGAPVAAPDAGGTTTTGAPLTGSGLLGNDSGTSPLIATVGAAPAHGTVAVGPTGTFIYTPAAGYSGPDSFTYTATDPYGQVSAPAAVSVRVLPSAAPASRTVQGGTTLQSSIPPATGTGPFVVAGTSTPAHGALTVRADGTFSYTPTPGYVGPDAFTYTVTDASGGVSVPATVTLTVLTPNRPVGQPDTAGVVTGSVLAGASVLANDAGTGSLTAAVSGTPEHGTVALAPDGTYSYRPVVEFSGVDTFTYTITDGYGQTSLPVTVTVTVAPLGAGDSANVAEGGVLHAPSVLGNDVGTGLTALAGSAPVHGTLMLLPDGTYTYTPAPGFAGTDSFTYVAVDAAGTRSAPVTVALTVTRAIPVVTGGTSQTTPVGGSFVPVTVTDPSGLVPTFSTGSPGSLPPGVTLLPTGALVGSPTRAGTYRFPVVVTDPAGGSVVVTVTLIVTPVAVVPVRPLSGPPVAKSTVVLNVVSVELGAVITGVTGHLPVGVRVEGSRLVGPPAHIGTYRVTVATRVHGRVVTRQVTILVTPRKPVITVPTGPLAYTGAPLSQLVALALLLVGLGCGLLFLGRVSVRRRRTA